LESNSEHSHSFFHIIRDAFKPILERGLNEGYKDLKKSDHLPLVIMVLAGLSTILVSLITLAGYFFREYFHAYVNHALVWSGLGVSLLLLVPALRYASDKGLITTRLTNSLFVIHFFFNFILVLIFQVFYQLTEPITFGLLLVNVSFSFLTAFLRKLTILGYLSYFIALFLPFFYFEIDIFYYLPFVLFTTFAFLLFAEYIENSRINVFVSIVTYVLYFVLLNKFASPETKFLFLGFMFLFSYLYLFFDFIVYKQDTRKIDTKLKLSLYDFALLLVSQIFVSFTIFSFFYSSYQQMALVALLNSLPFAAAYLLWRNSLRRDLRYALISFLLFYSLISVIIYFHNNITALILVGAFVALGTLNFGFIYDERKLRKITYLFLLFIGLYLFLGIYFIWQLWDVEYLHIGFYMFLYLDAILFVLLFIFKQNKRLFEASESFYFQATRIFAALLTGMIYSIFIWHVVLFEWFVVLFVIPFYIYLYLGRLENSLLLEAVAYFGILAVSYISLLVSYYQFAHNWGVTIYHLGLVYLFYVGFVFMLLRYLIKLINSTQQYERTLKFVRKDGIQIFNIDNESKRKYILLIIDNILQIWTLFMGLLFIKYYTGYWFSLLALFPAFIIISWAYLYQKELAKFLGYFIYAAVAFKILIYSFANQSGVSLFNILQIGFFITLIWFTRINVFYFSRKLSLSTAKVIVKKENNNDSEDYTLERLKHFFQVLGSLKLQFKEVSTVEIWKKKQINNHFYLLISFWLSFFMFFIGFYLDVHTTDTHFGYNTAFFTVFILLYLAGRLKHKAIENIALINFGVLFLGVLMSIIQSDFSYHFSEQPLFGKIAILQFYLALLVLYKFYDYFVDYSAYIEFWLAAHKLAVAALPFGIFYAGYRIFSNTEYESLIYYFPWFNALISFGLSQFYKLRMYVMQFYFWIMIAAIFVFIFPFPLVTVAGVIALVPLLFYKKGITKPITSYPKFEILPYFTLFYAIFSVFRSYLLVNNDLSGGIFLASSFIFALLFFQKYIYPVRRMKIHLYYLSILLIGLGFGFFLLDTNFAIDFRSSSYRIFSIVFMPFSLIMLHRLIFNLRNYPGRFFIIELLVVNVYYIFAYTSLILYFSGSYTHVTITLALFVHGISLLFRSVVPRYKLLLSIALLVFLLAIFKLFVIDIRHFSIVAKMLLFMLIGSLFFGGAIYFNSQSQKLKKQADEKI